MCQGLYNLNQGSLYPIQVKFDVHIVYFPNWGESDRIEFFVRNLKDSIRFQVKAHSPKTLDEAYALAMNYERKVNNRIERNKGLLGKRSLEFNYPGNQSSKFAKFSKTSKPSKFSKFNQRNKIGMLSKEDQEEHVKTKIGIALLNAQHSKEGQQQ